MNELHLSHPSLWEGTLTLYQRLVKTNPTRAQNKRNFIIYLVG